MKLLRFGPAGGEKPGVELENGLRLDVSAFTSDFDEAFFAEDGIKGLKKWLETHREDCPPVDSGGRSWLRSAGKTTGTEPGQIGAGG